MTGDNIFRQILDIRVDKAFGLDISDSSVEIIEMSRRLKYSVRTYGRGELEDGIVKEGRIINPNALFEKLRGLLMSAKPKRLSTNRVVLSLPESQVYTHSFLIDSKLKSSDEIRNAVMIEVVNLVPINISKLYWDFEVKDLVTLQKKQVVFMGIEKAIVDEYIKLCNSLGLEVVMLSSESMNLARVILKKSEEQDLIVDFGTKVTNISVFDSNDKLSLSVSLPLGGEHLTKAISNSMKIKEEEAEELKISWGLNKDSKNKILPIIEPLVKEIATELKKSIEYYERVFNQKIDNIYFVGGSSLLVGLIDYMNKEVGRDVKMATIGNNVKLNLISEKDSVSFFSNVLGLGMLGLNSKIREINLFRKVTHLELNSINKFDLFRLGYLSKFSVLRIIFNNVITLFIVIAIFALIFIWFARELYLYRLLEG